MSQLVKEIKADDFDRLVLQSTKPVLVDFWAEWCGPCRTLAPILDLVAERFAGTVDFFKLNVDDSPAIAQRYRIQGIPTLILFREAVEKDRIIGLTTEQKISSVVDRHLGAVPHPSSPRPEFG